MTHVPTISVVMPVYNAERYVASSIDGIRGQTFRDFEFVIVNDGSTDSSLDILTRYSNQDSRIRLVSRPNTGLVGALNDGVANARGEFIARIDADDRAKPNRFERQVRFLKDHPDYVGVGSAVMQIDPDGDPIAPHQWSPTHEEIEHNLLRGVGGMAHPASMLRRETVVDVGAYRPEICYGEDLDLWLRLIERGKLANLTEVLIEYRLHDDGFCVTRSDEQVVSGITRVVTDAYRRRGQDVPNEVLAGIAAMKAHRFLPEHWVHSAVNAGYLKTARKHARRMVIRTPFRPMAWSLMTLTLLGPRWYSLCETQARRVRYAVARVFGRLGQWARRFNDRLTGLMAR